MDLEKIKTCIFDVNGVLIDSNRANALAMAEAFAQPDDLRGPIAELYLSLTGIDRGSKIRIVQEKIVGRPFAEGEFDLRWSRFRELAALSMSKAPLIPGCREVLAELGRRGMVRAALSNTPEAELRKILAAHELTGSLDIIRGGGDWPKSESLARLLDDFKLNAGECVFLGDGKGDLDAARKAGVGFFGIDPGTGEFKGEKDLLGQFEDLAKWGRSFLGPALQQE